MRILQGRGFPMRSKAPESQISTSDTVMKCERIYRQQVARRSDISSHRWPPGLPSLDNPSNNPREFPALNSPLTSPPAPHFPTHPPPRRLSTMSKPPSPPEVY